MTIAFNQIPQSLRTPGFFAEVDPSKANTGAQNLKSLLVGQLTNSGSRCVTAATSPGTVAVDDADTLSFASADDIATVEVGMTAIDRTAPEAIANGVTVLSISGDTITLSAPLAGDVGAGDAVEFYDLTPVLLSSQTETAGLFGAGSQLARMYRVYRKNDPLGEIWAMPLPDDPASVAATGTILIAGAPTSSAVISLYVAGVLVPVVVTSAMDATQIASAIKSVINGNTVLPVTADNSGGTVTLTARNAGALGNDLDFRLNYRGARGGEATPDGLTITLTAMAAGATNPETALAAGLGQLPPERWTFIACGYGDTASLDVLKDFMDDITGQWAWLSMRYGGVFTALRGTLGALQSAGVGRNDQHLTIMGYNDSPTPPEEWAADYCAGYARMQRATAGGSANGVVMPSTLAPPNFSRFSITGQNTLLWSGISTFDVDRDGTVRIEKAITSYQFDRFGNADDSMLQIDSMFRLAFCLSYMKVKVQGKFAGARVADDGTRFGPGLNVVTPAIVKSELIALYGDLINFGLVFDLDGFAEGLIVERNTQNRARLDVLWPGAITSDLDIIALLAQFHS